jgi:hypothetical protein
MRAIDQLHQTARGVRLRMVCGTVIILCFYMDEVLARFKVRGLDLQLKARNKRKSKGKGPRPHGVLQRNIREGKHHVQK